MAQLRAAVETCAGGHRECTTPDARRRGLFARVSPHDRLHCGSFNDAQLPQCYLVSMVITVEKDLDIGGLHQAVVVGPERAANRHVGVATLTAANGKGECAPWLQSASGVVKDAYHFPGQGAFSRRLARRLDA